MDSVNSNTIGFLFATLMQLQEEITCSISSWESWQERFMMAQGKLPISLFFFGWVGNCSTVKTGSLQSCCLRTEWEAISAKDA